MNESVDRGIIDAIESAKPEDGTRRQELWTCRGTTLERPWWRWPKKSLPGVGQWTILYYSKEQAEAAASEPSDIWVWDRQPAVMTTLGDAMDRARRRHRSGVCVMDYRNGRWVEVSRHPVDAPLPD